MFLFNPLTKVPDLNITVNSVSIMHMQQLNKSKDSLNYLSEKLDTRAEHLTFQSIISESIQESVIKSGTNSASGSFSCILASTNMSWNNMQRMGAIFQSWQTDTVNNDKEARYKKAGRKIKGAPLFEKLSLSKSTMLRWNKLLLLLLLLVAEVATANHLPPSHLIRPILSCKPSACPPSLHRWIFSVVFLFSPWQLHIQHPLSSISTSSLHVQTISVLSL